MRCAYLVILSEFYFKCGKPIAMLYEGNKVTRDALMSLVRA